MANEAGRGQPRTHSLADLKQLRKQLKGAVSAGGTVSAPARQSQGVGAPVSVSVGAGLPSVAPRPPGKKKRKKMAGSKPAIAGSVPVSRVAGQAAALPRGQAVSSGLAQPADAPALSPDDLALFRSAVKSVRRIKDTRRVVLPPVRNLPQSLLLEKRARAAGLEKSHGPAVSDHFSPAPLHHDDTRFVRDRHSPDLIRQLERGRWPIGATLDLHGSTLDEARERLDRFLRSCTEHYIRCVRIVHGKGYGSKDGESVLKTTIRRWLTQLSSVQAYVQCNENDGGAGAVLVLLAEPPAP